MTRVPAGKKTLFALLLLAVLAVAGASLAEPVLHEYFDFDSEDGLREAANAHAQNEGEQADGTGANQASGRTSPDVQRGNNPSDDSYQLDSNTTRPDQVGYEDPFTPSIPPFKRLFAYDAVDENFELVVHEKALTRLNVGGTPITSNEDQFFGDLRVQLRAGVPERIPSVGPSTRILAARLEPVAPFKLEQDSAENWFITTNGDGEFRLTLHLSIDRRVFGSAFADPEWSDLEPRVPPVPEAVRRRALELAANIGVSREQRPRVAWLRLVEHYRGFAPSEDLPSALEPGALFREIALSQKGVCRHRSYAFAVTALALGLPVRFVRNEAHAWVEIHDGSLWHRVDLGGAAGEMQLSTQVDIAHVPPSDPFEWPEGSESASDMTDRALTPGGSSGSGRDNGARGQSDAAEGDPQNDDNLDPLPSATPNSTSQERPAPNPSTAFGEPAPALAPTSGELGTAPDNPKPAAAEATPVLVDLNPHPEVALKGSRLHLEGKVYGPDEACALLRVDALLVTAERKIPIGTLVTDKAGRYRGDITLPGSIPVGDYELKVVPHDAGRCRATVDR